MVFTNAAGGINLSYRQGALVLISDHINLQGSNPLIGPNDDSVGPRFPDMTEAYSPAYRAMAHQVAQQLEIQLDEGVYAALTGPELRDAGRDSLPSQPSARTWSACRPCPK